MNPARRFGLVIACLAVAWMAFGTAFGGLDLSPVDDQGSMKDMPDSPAGAKVTPTPVAVIPADFRWTPGPRAVFWLTERSEQTTADFVAAVRSPRSPPQFLS